MIWWQNLYSDTLISSVCTLFETFYVKKLLFIPQVGLERHASVKGKIEKNCCSMIHALLDSFVRNWWIMSAKRIWPKWHVTVVGLYVNLKIHCFYIAASWNHWSNSTEISTELVFSDCLPSVIQNAPVFNKINLKKCLLDAEMLVLGLGLGRQVLGLGLGLEHKVLVNNRRHAVDCQSQS